MDEDEIEELEEYVKEEEDDFSGASYLPDTNFER